MELWGQGRVQQLTGLIGRTTGPALLDTGELLDSFYRYPVEQNSSNCWQAIHCVFDNRFRATTVT